MAKKTKCPECPAGEKWAVPYADFLSLLLALFIALWAISKTDTEKIKALKVEFIKIFDFTPTQTLESDTVNQERFQGSAEKPDEQIEALKALTMTQQETIQKLRAALDQSENQVATHLPARIPFERGSAVISSADVQDSLKYIVDFSKRLGPNVKIEIRGFTDNSDSARTSYDLAYERAKAVGDYFIEGGVDVKNLSLKSYGLNSPLNNDASSELNNRVEIYYKIDTANEALQKSVLEQINQNFNPQRN